MADPRPANARPLSPHLQIYKPTWTMTMSIANRIAGCAAYVGFPLLAWWLLAASEGPGAYAYASAFFGSWFGILVLIGFSFALIHHAVAGVRHLVWDLVIGMDLRSRMLWAQATLVVSVILTVLLWVAIFINVR